MIRSYLLSVATFVMLVTMSSRALALDLGVMGSYWSMENTDGSAGFGAKAGLPLLTDYLKAEARGYWFSDINDTFGGDVDIVPIDFGLSVSFLPHSEVNLYGVGGLGYLFVNDDDVSLDNDLGYYIGGGFEVDLIGPVELFSEVLYRFAEFEADGRLSGRGELDTSGLCANVGLQFDL